MTSSITGACWSEWQHQVRDVTKGIKNMAKDGRRRERIAMARHVRQQIGSTRGYGPEGPHRFNK